MPFPRIFYDEAVQLIQKHGSEIQWGGDFGGGDETIISQQFDKPVMVHRYPTAVKAFYMEPDPERPEVALCVDVLAPEGYGEIVGGGQRISSYDLLARRIKEHDLPREAFEWYLDLRKPSSGISICGSSDPCLTQASAWVLSEPSHGFAGWNTCAKPFRSRGCCPD